MRTKCVVEQQLSGKNYKKMMRVSSMLCPKKVQEEEIEINAKNDQIPKRENMGSLYIKEDETHIHYVQDFLDKPDDKLNGKRVAYEPSNINWLNFTRYTTS